MDIYQDNQYDIAKSYLLCYPVNFKKIYKNVNIVNYELLYSQYNNFINELIDNDIKVKFLDIIESSEQIYTKDIGFVIKDIFFISKMNKKERQLETVPLKKFIFANNLKHYEMQNNIEGGDVLLYDDVLFVGLSTRTTIKAVHELQKVLNRENVNIKVISINFDTSKLHLDCVFNTLELGSGIISPYVYDIEVIQKYVKNLYYISKEDTDKFGTNYIYLGNKKVISSNKNTVNLLNDNGYKAKFIDYSEVTNGGGSLACSNLSILREK